VKGLLVASTPTTVTPPNDRYCTSDDAWLCQLSRVLWDKDLGRYSERFWLYFLAVPLVEGTRSFWIALQEPRAVPLSR
jgi:hypothetical protein